VRSDLRGIELDRLARCGGRFFDQPGVLRRRAEVDVRGKEIRLKGDGPAVRLDRLRQSAQLREDRAAVDVSGGVVRVDRQRLLRRGEAFIQPAEPLVRRGQVRRRLGVIRRHRGGALPLLGRFVQPPQVHQRRRPQ
jgi:hypothetical protein